MTAKNEKHYNFLDDLPPEFKDEMEKSKARKELEQQIPLYGYLARIEARVSDKTFSDLGSSNRIVDAIRDSAEKISINVHESEKRQIAAAGAVQGAMQWTNTLLLALAMLVAVHVWHHW